MKKLYGLTYYYENILRSNDLYVLNSLLQKEVSYREITVKKKGGERILRPLDKSSGIYQLQRNLNRNFLQNIPLSWPAFGFVKGRGYRDYLLPHCGKKYHLRLDIRDFFGSITEEQVRESLEEFVQDDDIRDSIVQICTLDGSLPQGAVTSPALSNIVFRRIDQRILLYCQAIDKVKTEEKSYEEDIVYTRYADDLLFSSDYLDFSRQLSFYKMIKHILRENGLRLNYEKTYMTEGEMSLSGFVIGGDVHLARKRLREINEILYYFDKREVFGEGAYAVDEKKIKDKRVLNQVNRLVSEEKFVRFRNKKAFINYLCGCRAFFIAFVKGEEEETPQLKSLKKKIKKLEKLIDGCQKIWFGFQ